MKFMALEPWFHNGVFYPADNDHPHIFDFPKGEIPSRRWYPLDKEAREALEKYQKVKADNGVKIDIHPIPDLAISTAKAEPIPPTEKPDPHALPPSLVAAQLAGAAKEAVPTPSMSEIQREPARPSDTEPTKRR